MTFLYRLSIWFYQLVIYVASAKNNKARQWISGRKGWEKKIIQADLSGHKVAWFHCASLGEFEQGRPVLEAFKESHPDTKIVLTFFSPSGFEIRKNYPVADVILYLPIDSPTHAKRFLDLVKPRVVYFVKYEFWYFYLRELNRSDIPVFLISAIFRPTQIFFKSYGKWYRQMLFWYRHIFVQNQESKVLLYSIGVEPVTISGDTRFDRVAAIAKSAKQLPIIESFKANRKMIVAGSTWPPDEELLYHFYTSTQLEVCFAIAPHEINKSNINRLQKLFGESCTLYSLAENQDLSKYKVLLIDNIGLLSSIYQYGEIAYVGGAFKTGLHNVLEPACFSIPVVFGPNYSKFQEAKGLLETSAGISLSNSEELEKNLDKLLKEKELLDLLSEKAGRYITTHIGATKIILEKSKQYYLD